MKKQTAFEIAKALNTQTRLTPGEEGIRAARADARKQRRDSYSRTLAARSSYAGPSTLRHLHRFFQPGRNEHGGMFNPNEHIVNATERNLSLFSDEELHNFIHAANEFKQLVAQEIDSRTTRGDNDKRDGTVCAQCGKTMTQAEYSRGESRCCNAYVIPEEQFV